ncbi:MAG: helix-turn-helix domain-containing protein [Deltaproteobacteria bacterium]|nr:helix-turn-helix domain-containing protein [Deltaproteobacteria bacterium]
MNAARQAVHQGFLPSQGASRAFVWKYSPVNWGRRPRHFHIEPEINLVASGRAAFGIGETVVEVEQGDLLRFPPAQDHVLLAASPDLYLFAIGMDPALSSDVLRAEADQVMLPLRLRLPDGDFRALVNRASAIVDRDGVEQPCAELWEHAYWLGARPRAHSAATMHVLTRRALSAVSQAPDLGLDLLSSRMRTAGSEISRYFHRDVGMTFVRFRTRLRLLRLIRLMDGGDVTLGEAADRAGFGSYSQCHRAFQAELGCSPQRFFHSGLRQQMQQAYDP